MAKIPGTAVASPIVPLDSGLPTPTHVDTYGKGGWVTVASLAERNAIPPERRKPGMVAAVADAPGSTPWELATDLMTWMPFRPPSFPNAEIFTNTSLAIAGTTAGDWFYVADETGKSLYRNVAGVATFIILEASAAQLTEATQVTTDNAALAVAAKEAAEEAADRVDLGALDDAVAATEADAMQTAEDRAQTAADRAQVGIDAIAAAEAAATAAAASESAFISADVFDDTADGLAATAEDEQFQVIENDGDESARYRHDAGPVATEVARFPTAQIVRQLLQGGGEIIPSEPVASTFASYEQVHGLRIVATSTATSGNTQNAQWALRETLPINTPLTVYCRCTGSGVGANVGIQLYQSGVNRGFRDVTVGGGWFRYRFQSMTGVSNQFGVFIANGSGVYEFEIFAVREADPYGGFNLSNIDGPLALDALDARASLDPTAVTVLGTPSVAGLLRSISAADLLTQVRGEVLEWETHDGLVASQPTRALRPTVQPGVGGIDFGTVDKFATAYLPQRLVQVYSLPNSTVAPADLGGWTITGIDRGPDLRWYASNDGRANGGDATFEPSILILDQDWGRIINEIALAPLYSGINTVQGVAFDTSDDTIWFADTRTGDANSFIRHVTTAGEAIAADEITIIGYNVNGIAYNAGADSLYTCRANSGIIEERSCVDGSLLSSFTVAVGNPDQLHFGGEYLWISSGANGSNGEAWVYTTTGRLVAQYKGLTRAQSMEGIWVDQLQRQLWVASDGGFHTNATPAANVVLQYDIDLPPSDAAPDTLLWVGLLQRTTIGGFRQIYSFEDATSSDAGWGLGWRTGLNQLQLSAFKDGTQYAIRWPVSALNDYVIMALSIPSGGTPLLWINGESVESTGAVLDIADYDLGFSGATFTLCGDRDGGTGGNRFLGLITAREDTDREKAEGWLAHAFRRTDLLPDAHPHKTTAPT